jgi:alkanesulfonate monooxygenase SsuD/methylene tetrahydromethanopterin reductase-like flavin-dependent oxidoreductase (luciferase family)
MKTRMDRLAEQLEIVTRSWQDGVFSFAGEHYAVEELDARPKPVQGPLPLVMGGGAKPRAAALAARYAAEYNVVYVGPEEARASHERLVAACRDAGRDPATLRFSLMHGFLIGADEADLRARADRLAEWNGEPVALDELRRTWVAGTPDEVIARLREYEAAGVERVMLQHNVYRDLEALELLAAEVVPALS